MTENRYRRLLALYPSDFRREYEEEMLGVLLADPRPGPGQVFDLVRGALAARLRQPFAAGDEWRRAARVVQLFGAILLLAVSVRLVAMTARTSTIPGAPDFVLDEVTAVRLIGWTMVVIAAVLGARLFGLAGAITGLAGEIARPAQDYAETPATVLHAFWLIVAAAVVLVAGLVADRGSRPRGWLAPAVRLRVLVMVVPVLVTVPLVRIGFNGFVMYNQGHPESLRMLTPLHFAVLVVIPAVAFWGAAELGRRFEARRAGEVRAHE